MGRDEWLTTKINPPGSFVTLCNERSGRCIFFLFHSTHHISIRWLSNSHTSIPTDQARVRARARPSGSMSTHHNKKQSERLRKELVARRAQWTTNVCSKVGDRPRLGVTRFNYIVRFVRFVHFSVEPLCALKNADKYCDISEFGRCILYIRRWNALLSTRCSSMFVCILVID